MDKDIGILTLDPMSCNYGGILQEMALQDAIQTMGISCEIINYAPSNELNTFSVKRDVRYLTFEKIFRKVKDSIQKVCSQGSLNHSRVIRMKRFDSFRSTHLLLSAPIKRGELRGNKLPYSAIICGSDQIWNPDYNIPAFFLDFVQPDQKKIIYAASIGRTKLSNIQKKVYKKYLQNLDYISVREESAQNMLQCITEKDVKLVLDPTLLHNKEYWIKKADTSPMVHSNYIFCYFLEINEEKIKAARKYAKTRNCKIVAIPSLHGENDRKTCRMADILEENATPADFLKLIMNADCILTDSFHASVFSLLFEKKFWVFGRNIGSYNMNTRIHTLLGYFDADDRLIMPKELKNRRNSACVNVEERLKEMRKNSYRYLNNALNIAHRENRNETVSG